MAIEVTVLKKVEKEAEDKKGHTYIHFGGNMQKRLKVLAELCGYTRKLNDFAVLIFDQAITEAEKDFDKKHPGVRKPVA